MRRSIVNVCGVTKGACVPGQDPGRQPEVPGSRQLRKFKVTIRLIAELYPRLTNARRWNFQNAITAHPASRLATPTVLWDMLNEATVAMECMACDAAAAAESVRTIIRRTAEPDAQIGVREIKVVTISSAD
jgi:hypothetical protein